VIRLDNAPSMISRFIAVFALVVPATAAAGNIDQIQQLLGRMQHAAHTVSYDGTFVYSQNSQLTVMRLIHGADEHGERERLVSLDSTGREVIRDKNGVTCILPDSNAVVVEKKRPPVQFPPPFPEKIDHLSKQYYFMLKGEEKVAGQTAIKLVIEPRDALRYGHALWIDKKTGLLLKTYLLNEQGKPIEQFMFTHIKYLTQVPDSLFKPAVDSRKFNWFEANGKTTGDEKPAAKRRWQITKLPVGFKRDYQGNLNSGHKDKALDHLVFSDGLASISVFIEDNNDADHLIGGTRMGAVNAHGRAYKDFHVTAVGEVPPATVKMISESVSWQQQ